MLSHWKWSNTISWVFHLITGIYRFPFSLHKKIKFSIKEFFSECDQICSFLRIWSHLLKKSLMENFVFCVHCFLQRVVGKSDKLQMFPLSDSLVTSSSFEQIIFRSRNESTNLCRRLSISDKPQGEVILWKKDFPLVIFPIHRREISQRGVKKSNFVTKF